MVAFILAPFVLLWTVDNQEFFEKMTDAEWNYVGYQERTPGPQPDGSYALTLESDGKTFILYKQQWPEREISLAGIAE